MFSEDLFRQQTGEDFTKFYEEYNPKLISFIGNICKDRDMAHDIATNSYIAAFDNILSYNKEIAKFSTWLFTIAKNKTLREISVNKRISYQDIVAEDIHDDEPTKHELFDVEDKAKIIIEQIENLPEPYKNVMDLLINKKMKYNDISIFLGDENNPKNLNTIKSWIRKGKSLLKDLSEKEFDKKIINEHEFSKYA